MTMAGVVLADNPVHFWRLADQGGAIAHDIGSAPSHLGGNVNASGYSGPSSDGGSWLNDGNSNTGEFSYTPIVRASPLSIELWFWQLWGKGVSQYLIAWDNAVNPSAYCWVLASGILNCNLNTSAQLNSLAAPAIQTWHHVVITYDGANIKLYLDNVLQQTLAYAVAFTINRNLGLGNLPTSGNPFSGVIADVAIYSYALIAAQVTAHWNAADTRLQAPVFHGPGLFDTGSGVFTPGSASLASILNSVRKVY